MSSFKPSDIRILAVLAALAILGSAISLLQRNDKLSRFNLGAFTDKGGYKYSYPAAYNDVSETSESVSDNLRDVAALRLDSSERIDLNSCGYFDLEALPGIGPVLAEYIIAFRDSVGRFQEVDDLLEVKGIGPAKLAMIRDKVAAK